MPRGSERFREEYRIVNVNACGEAFCRGEIGGYDDVSDFLISESTDVKLCNVNRTLGVDGLYRYIHAANLKTPGLYMRLKVVRQ